MTSSNKIYRALAAAMVDGTDRKKQFEWSNSHPCKQASWAQQQRLKHFQACRRRWTVSCSCLDATMLKPRRMQIITNVKLQFICTCIELLFAEEKHPAGAKVPSTWRKPILPGWMPKICTCTILFLFKFHIDINISIARPKHRFNTKTHHE